MSPKVVARYAVAALGCLVLLVAAVPAASAFRSAITPDPAGTVASITDPAGLRELDRIHHAQFECIRARLEDQVPAGAPVYVPEDPDAPEAGLWQQRLTELAFPLAPIVASPGPGVTTITVAVDDTGTGCTGVRLVVEPG